MTRELPAVTSLQNFDAAPADSFSPEPLWRATTLLTGPINYAHAPPDPLRVARTPLLI